MTKPVMCVQEIVELKESGFNPEDTEMFHSRKITNQTSSEKSKKNHSTQSIENQEAGRPWLEKKRGSEL